MSDDWQVVQAALSWDLPDGDAGSGMVAHEEALAAIARLREREAQLEGEREWIKERHGQQADRANRAEAHVAELEEEALREIAALTSNATIKEGSPVSYALGPQIARRALAHKEETP